MVKKSIRKQPAMGSGKRLKNPKLGLFGLGRASVVVASAIFFMAVEGWGQNPTTSPSSAPTTMNLPQILISGSTARCAGGSGGQCPRVNALGTILAEIQNPATRKVVMQEIMRGSAISREDRELITRLAGATTTPNVSDNERTRIANALAPLDRVLRRKIGGVPPPPANITRNSPQFNQHQELAVLVRQRVLSADAATTIAGTLGMEHITFADNIAFPAPTRAAPGNIGVVDCTKTWATEATQVNASPANITTTTCRAVGTWRHNFARHCMGRGDVSGSRTASEGVYNARYIALRCQYYFGNPGHRPRQKPTRADLDALVIAYPYGGSIPSGTGDRNSAYFSPFAQRHQRTPEAPAAPAAPAAAPAPAPAAAPVDERGGVTPPPRTNPSNMDAGAPTGLDASVGVDR